MNGWNGDDVGRGKQETQINYSEEGERIFGIDREPNESSANYDKTQRPTGIDQGIVRNNRHKRARISGLKDGNEMFSSGVREKA